MCVWYVGVLLLWCVVRGVWCCGVWCDTLKNPVCGFKTSPCVHSKRLRVPAKRPRDLSTWAFEVDAGNVRPSWLHHLPGANLSVATALKITVYTKRNVNMHMNMSVGLLNSHEKSNLEHVLSMMCAVRSFRSPTMDSHVFLLLVTVSSSLPDFKPRWTCKKMQLEGWKSA